MSSRTDQSIRFLMFPQDDSPLPRDSEGCPAWLSPAVTVAALTALGIVSQVFCNELNARPGVAMGVGLVAGALGPALASCGTPHKATKGVFNLITKFDVSIFEFLSMFQQVAPQTVFWRQVFFPAIFAHEGAVITWEIGQKLRNDALPLRDRPFPLMEGDTRGSTIPFACKGVLLFFAGSGLMFWGAVRNNLYGWHYGLILAGMGAALPLAQPCLAKLKKLNEEYVNLMPSARLMEPISFRHRLLDGFSRTFPTLGKVAVCAASAGLALTPPTSGVPAALLTAAAGIPAAFTDLARQDTYQYGNGQQDNSERLLNRIWADLRERPADHAGIVLTAGGVTALFIANLNDPSSIMNASLILGCSVGGFILTKMVKELCPLGKNRLANQINLRTTRMTHILALGFLPLLGNYYAGNISLEATWAMWAIFGSFLGMFLKEMLDDNADADASISTLFLMLVTVTNIGYATGVL